MTMNKDNQQGLPRVSIRTEDTCNGDEKLENRQSDVSSLPEYDSDYLGELLYHFYINYMLHH